MSDYKYIYQDPKREGYKKVRLKKKQIKELIKTRYYKFTRYEIYENEEKYLIQEFNSHGMNAINIILYPFLVLVYGLADIKQLNKEIYNELFPKKNGAFSSYYIYKDVNKEIKSKEPWI